MFRISWPEWHGPNGHLGARSPPTVDRRHLGFCVERPLARPDVFSLPTRIRQSAGPQFPKSETGQSVRLFADTLFRSHPSEDGRRPLSFKETPVRRGDGTVRAPNFARPFASRRRTKGRQSDGCDPQPGVVQEQYPRTAMCVRNVDVHVSCSSQVDAQLAAFFIDPRAK